MVALLRPAGHPVDRQHSDQAPSRGGLRLIVDNTVDNPRFDNTKGESPARSTRARATGDPVRVDRSLLATIAVAAVVVFGGLFTLRLVQDVTPTSPASIAVAGNGPGGAGQVGAIGGSGQYGEEAGEYVVAKPGDSLWSIARTIAPESDPRPVVAALIEANGDDSVRIGQQIVIPQQLLD